MSRLAFASIVLDILLTTNNIINLYANNTGTPNTSLPPYIVAI